jgi:acetoin utilization deacetylase AcuC-like enzyme
MAHSPSRVAVFWDERMLDHDTGAGFFELEASPLLEVLEKHPENADRIRNIVAVLKKGPLTGAVDWHDVKEATVEDMSLVHPPEHLAQLQEASITGKRYGVSTVLPQGGWRGISLACGAACGAMDAVLAGTARVAYACVRPPGHHAGPAAVDGYCFVGNTACAAARAVKAGERPAVLDVDVHHGNGTQAIFYSRSDVLTCSMHQHMGAWDEGTSHTETGDVNEVGCGAGVGFNVNVPLELGSGDATHLEAFEQIIVPEVKAFDPSILVVALGVDGSQFDPNGRQAVTMAGYFNLGRAIAQLAAQHCGGRVVVVQEGGYALSYAAYCVHAFLEGVRGQTVMELRDPLGSTYPDPPLRDPQGWKSAALITKLKQEREQALAAARGK